MDHKAKERVAIAKDALAWVQAGALVPASNVYVIPVSTGVRLFLTGDSNKQLRDVVLGPCRVCAKGALFLAKAVRFDNVSIEDYNRCNWEEPLLEHFDIEQLSLIERWFEGWSSLGNDAWTFRWHHPDNTERMTLILQNIIDHDGTFDPFSLDGVG